MRAIETEENLERKRKRNVRIITFILLGIMILSIVGSYYGLRETQTGTTMPNGLQNFGGRWVYPYGSSVQYFTNSPDEVKNISNTVFLNVNYYSGKTVYIATDNDGVYLELVASMTNYAGRVQRACYGNCSQDLPIKDCSSDMLVWKDSSTRKVYQQDSCVFIDGDYASIDSFFYKLLELI